MMLVTLPMKRFHCLLSDENKRKINNVDNQLYATITVY